MHAAVQSCMHMCMVALLSIIIKSLHVVNTSQPAQHSQQTLICIIGVGIGVAVVMVTAIVLCGTTIFLFHKRCKSNKDPT